MMSVGDLEKSVFLHESVVSFRSGVDHDMRLINHALEQEGSMRLINIMGLITRCT